MSTWILLRQTVLLSPQTGYGLSLRRFRSQPPGKSAPGLPVPRPGHSVRPLTQEELEFLPYVAGNYVKLKDPYLAK